MESPRLRSAYDKLLLGKMKDKLGFSGTLFASLCCLGVSVIIAPLTAIGLGFLINDLVLLPLVLVFLLITLWGLYNGWRRHDDRRPFLLGIFAGVLLIPSFFLSVYFAATLLVLLLVSTIWNTAAVKQDGIIREFSGRLVPYTTPVSPSSFQAPRDQTQ